jgi:flagellar motor switch protein FliG
MATRVGGRRRLGGVHKVAILLRLLDDEVAREILKNLDDRELARIHRADADLGNASPDLVREVAREVRTRLSSGGDQIGQIQRKRVEHLLERTFDQEKLSNIFGRTDTEVAKLQDTLADIDPRVVGRILSREYPQTSALVLSQLPPMQASEVLTALPDDYRVEVMMRLARLDQISEEMLVELTNALKRELSGFEGAMQAQEMVGIDHAVQIFSKLDRTSESTLLESIAEQDEDIAQQMRERMFTFEDLMEVDDRGIQTLLRNVESRTLVLALRGASEELKEKFLRNVSKRVASSIVEDLETLGPVRLSEVETAQKSIANGARELQERGEIVGAGRDDDVVV